MNRATRLVTVPARVPADLAVAIRTRATARGVSESTVVRELLADAIVRAPLTADERRRAEEIVRLQKR
jgi:hypothetical protein